MDDVCEKLAELGDKCLQEHQFAYTAKAYELSEDKERLSKLGDACLKEGLIKTAVDAYTKAGNEIMIQFIKENFLKE